MTQTIKLNNGDILNFPDEMSDDQIQAAIHKEYGPPQSSKMSAPVAPTSAGLFDPSNQSALGTYVPPGTYDQPYAKAALEFGATLPLGLGEAPAAAALGAKYGIPRLAEVAGIAGKNAAVGGGLGAVNTNKADDLFYNTIAGLVSGGLIGGGIGAAGQAIEALRPANWLKSNLSPEQLQQNLDVTKGTTTGLGDVIESPFLKRLQENVLPKLFLSNANDVMQKTANQVKGKAADLLNRFKGNIDESDMGVALQDALKKSLADVKNLKNKNYADLNKAADDLGVNVQRNNFSSEASNILNEINQSPELKREMPSEILSDLKSYSNPDEANNLRLSNIFKGKIGDKASEHYINGKGYEYGIYKSLKDALQKDIDQSIESSGSVLLKDKYLKAEDFYRKEIAPFEDPEITKFTRRGADPDLLLSSFIKNSRINDRGTLLSKLLERLPPAKKGIVPYAYLARSIEDGEVNPLTLRSLYRNLGDKQKTALFYNRNDRNAIENFAQLVDKNTEPLTLMANAKTGQRNLDALPYFLGLSGHSTGLLAGLSAGGIPGAITGGITGLVAPGLLSRPIVNKLTNESIRESLIKAMIKGGKLPWLGSASNIAASALNTNTGNSTDGT